MPDKPEIQELKAHTKRLGIDAFAITSIQAPEYQEHIQRWMSEAQYGEMEWMANGLEKRLDPQQILPKAKSIICFLHSYDQEPPEREGRIARYALGKDYHKIFYKKLKQICAWLQEQGGINRPYVDTGPILEKNHAQRAGLGWIGKHTNLVHPKLGNFTFLGVILTSLEFDPTNPIKHRCGNCSRCIDACPTGAITAPYELDPRKCISYLTIEHKGSIPLEIRPLIGDHLYGCDDCLSVCPWNKWAKKTSETRFHTRPYPDLTTMLKWDDETFREVFAGTAIKRVGLTTWKRNCCIVLGNKGSLGKIPVLEKVAASSDELLAEHAKWAIDQIQKRSNNGK